MSERDANDKYSRNWRRILNPTPAAASRWAVTMVTSIIRLSLVTLDIQKYTFFPSFFLRFTSILCVPNNWILSPGCLGYVHVSISLHALNTRWMMLVRAKSSFLLHSLGLAADVTPQTGPKLRSTTGGNRTVEPGGGGVKRKGTVALNLGFSLWSNSVFHRLFLCGGTDCAQ